jgi:hypothetical protein
MNKTYEYVKIDTAGEIDAMTEVNRYGQDGYRLLPVQIGHFFIMERESVAMPVSPKAVEFKKWEPETREQMHILSQRIAGEGPSLFNKPPYGEPVPGLVDSGVIG